MFLNYFCKIAETEKKPCYNILQVYTCIPNTKPLMGEIRGKMEKKALLHNKTIDSSEMFSTFAPRKNLILICHTRVVHDRPAVF